VDVNVAAFTPSLVESELFGHEPDASPAPRAGGQVFSSKLEGERCSSMRLESWSLPSDQACFGLYKSAASGAVGSNEDEFFNARLVCATNRKLIADVKAERFRQGPVPSHRRTRNPCSTIAPARAGWFLLASVFLNEYPGRKATLARETHALLSGYSFPGNVRELKNLIQSAIAACDGNETVTEPFPCRTDARTRVVSVKTNQSRSFCIVPPSYSSCRRRTPPNKSNGCSIESTCRSS